MGRRISPDYIDANDVNEEQKRVKRNGESLFREKVTKKMMGSGRR